MNKQQTTALPLLTDKLTQLKRYYIKNQALLKKLGFDVIPFIATIKKADAVLKQYPSNTTPSNKPGIIKADGVIGEQVGALHVHPFSKGDVIEITPQTRIDFGIEQTLVETVQNGQVMQYWVETASIGSLPQTINDIPEAEREKVVLRFTELSYNKYTDVVNHPQVPPNGYTLSFHFSDIPAGLRPMLQNVVYAAIDKTKNQSDKFDSYSAMNLPLVFGSDAQIQTQYGLDAATAAVYANQERGFRFTLFPLDVALTGSSTDDHTNKPQTALLVLVEDLGTIQLKIPTSLSAAALQQVDAKIKESEINIDATNMTANEVECLKGVLSVLPESVWKCMNGIHFKADNKVLISNKTNGMYSMGEDKNNGWDAHTIYLRQGVLSKNEVYLGDDDNGNSELARFINSAQYMVLHELGHVVDFSPVRKFYGDYTKIYPKIGTDMNSEDKDVLNKIVEALKDGEHTYSGHIAYIIDPKTYKLTEKKNVPTKFSKLISQKSPSTNGYKLSSLTVYGDTAIEEAFAESFAIFIGAPHLMASLDPDVYAYFKKILQE